MYEIQHVVNGHDIKGLTETLSSAFDLDIDIHEVFIGKDKVFLKRYSGLVFIVHKSLKYQFTKTDLGLWLKVPLEAIDYWFGLYFIPGDARGTRMLKISKKSKMMF